MNLPAPRQEIPYTEHREVGRFLIVPISLEAYHEGFNPTVEDRYERGEKAWVWRERRRVFIRPVHYSYGGERRPCETCERYQSRWPNGQRPDEVIAHA